MTARSWICLVSILFFAVTFGCVSHPKTTQKNGSDIIHELNSSAEILQSRSYTNSEFQYSVKIPTGWDLYERPFLSVPIVEIDKLSEDTNIVLVHESQRGYIVIGSSAASRSIKGMVHTTKKELEAEWCETIRASIERRGTMKRYECTVYPENFFKTLFNHDLDASPFAIKEFLIVETELSEDGKVGILRGVAAQYPCSENNGCVLMIGLMANKESYEGIRKDFDAVVSSLSSFDHNE